MAAHPTTSLQTPPVPRSLSRGTQSALNTAVRGGCVQSAVATDGAPHLRALPLPLPPQLLALPLTPIRQLRQRGQLGPNIVVVSMYVPYRHIYPCVQIVHTNPLTRYLVEGVCTLTTLKCRVNYYHNDVESETK